METYICPACQIAVPPEAFTKNELARFCINCGLPVSMICPYEETSDPDATRLMLRNKDGLSPSACTASGCGGLLKFCPRCGRLHRLQDTVCRTRTCAELVNPSPLQEASLPYATGWGALERTHSAVCRGQFTAQEPRQISTQQMNSHVDQLAYRYGVLVAASGRNLSTYQWDGKGWQMRNSSLSLSPTPQARARSLILDSGAAFVLTTEGWYVVALDTVTITDQRPEPCSLQAKRGAWWARLKRGDSPTESILMIMNCDIWEEISVVLPVPQIDVADMVIGDKIYLACSNGDLFVIDPVTGKYDQKEMYHAWRRLALLDRRLIMMGGNENGQTLLAALHENGQQEGPYPHSERLLTDMAVINDEVYIGGADQIAQYRATQLAQRPNPVNSLAHSEQTQDSFIALRDQAGSVRLVLYRSDSSKGHLYLYDPAHGNMTPIGSLLIHPPCFCVTDDRLVVALREQSTKLNTYVLGE